MTWLSLVRRYLAVRWPHAAAKSRDSMTDGLASVTPALVCDMSGRPDPAVLRRVLRQHALVPESRRQEQPADCAAALRWLERASLPLVELTDAAVIRQALDALAVRLDGQAAAATTTSRKRAVFYNVLQYAVELELIPYNPVDKLRVRSARPKVTAEVDRRVVVNPRQARELLAAVTYVGARGKEIRLSVLRRSPSWRGRGPAGGQLQPAGVRLGFVDSGAVTTARG